MRLRVKNWKTFQHYKDRCPPWIKLHISLFHSKDWVSASDCERVLAIASMLVASQDHAGDGSFDADPEYVKRVAYLNSTPDFNPLITRGFLETVNGDASACYQMLAKDTTEESRGETEKSREEKESTFVLSPETEKKLDGDPIPKVFEYFVKKAEKTRYYTLTEKRQKMAKKRWEEQEKMLLSSGVPKDKLRGTIGQQFRKIIDELVASPYHQQNGYVEWDQLFSSREKFEKWIDRYENNYSENQSQREARAGA